MFASAPISPFMQSCLVLVLCLFYLIFAPYIKVEESFSTQAIHDYIYLSNPLSLPARFVHFVNHGFHQPLSHVNQTWDHQTYPGKFYLQSIFLLTSQPCRCCSSDIFQPICGIFIDQAISIAESI